MELQVHVIKCFDCYDTGVIVRVDGRKNVKCTCKGVKREKR